MTTSDCQNNVALQPEPGLQPEMLTDLHPFVAQPGNLPPQFAAPAAAAAPGPGGAAPGYVPTSAQAAQALKQQTAELKKFWREQQAEIEQVSSASEVS
jgi:hypothetical protein